MKYEVPVEIAMIRTFTVEAESEAEAVRKGEKEALDSLEPMWAMEYSEETCSVTVQKENVKGVI
ncbi:hypothetical protein SAMN02745671_01132 [Anaerovibrio lipolyticus DSM 3074]|uniref:DpnD/PcfM-like protein n=1 Tax=Anaerovibrio lipolyticus DSM 3074 TaxID=1120997 RepID=A0A1M6CJ24_9FIRM|nr:hypothetical protein [Anaerovibrio lipolyticus]SHI60913.1 hypothetical protein SAMN02745671_01132 [Anaerovibrio lipolyticus DSM 3074]